MMTDEAYVAAYQKLTREYQDNRLSMEEYLTAVERLKAEYFKGKTGTALPVVPCSTASYFRINMLRWSDPDLAPRR
jgi:hypothetical protein